MNNQIPIQQDLIKKLQRQFWISMIISVAGVVIGVGLLILQVQLVPEVPTVPPAPALEVTEEDCEQFSGRKKDKCYFNAFKESRDPNLCYKIGDHSELKITCLTLPRLMKLRNGNPIPEVVASSDERLKNYIIENLLARTPSEIEALRFCRMRFLRGDFNRDNNREIFVAMSCGLAPSAYGLLREQEGGFFITSWQFFAIAGIHGAWPFEEKIVSGEPPFIIVRLSWHAGTGLSDEYRRIFQIRDKEDPFDEIKEIPIGSPGSAMSIKAELVDIGGDGKLELLDFKTSPRPKDSPDLIAAYERQLCTYAHILEQRHGRHVDRLLLYWTSEARKEDALMFIPYDPKRVEEAGQYFDETVRRIQAREFAVSTPPEAAICKECDLRMLCYAEGVISKKARG